MAINFLEGGSGSRFRAGEEKEGPAPKPKSKAIRSRPKLIEAR